MSRTLYHIREGRIKLIGIDEHQAVWIKSVLSTPKQTPNQAVYLKNMDMERALTNARKLYNMTRDHELKVVMDRAELCWCKWRDDSDYRALMEKCVDVLSCLFWISHYICNIKIFQPNSKNHEILRTESDITYTLQYVIFPAQLKKPWNFPKQIQISHIIFNIKKFPKTDSDITYTLQYEIFPAQLKKPWNSQTQNRYHMLYAIWNFSSPD